jgi:hypothetical protein
MAKTYQSKYCQLVRKTVSDELGTSYVDFDHLIQITKNKLKSKMVSEADKPEIQDLLLDLLAYQNTGKWEGWVIPNSPKPSNPFSHSLKPSSLPKAMASKKLIDNNIKSTIGYMKLVGIVPLNLEELGMPNVACSLNSIDKAKFIHNDEEYYYLSMAFTEAGGWTIGAPSRFCAVSRAKRPSLEHIKAMLLDTLKMEYPGSNMIVAGRYLFNFDELPDAMSHYLLDACRRGDGKKIDYSWISPLLETKLAEQERHESSMKRSLKKTVYAHTGLLLPGQKGGGKTSNEEVSFSFGNSKTITSPYASASKTSNLYHYYMDSSGTVKQGTSSKSAGMPKKAEPNPFHYNTLDEYKKAKAKLKDHIYGIMDNQGHVEAIKSPEEPSIPDPLEDLP